MGNLSVAKKTLFSWKQIRELRLGLENGLDYDVIKSYFIKDFSAKEMAIKRKKIEEETDLIDIIDQY